MEKLGLGPPYEGLRQDKNLPGVGVNEGVPLYVSRNNKKDLSNMSSITILLHT